MIVMETITIITVLKDDLVGFERTLNSIKCQESQGFEYLVIDGSREDTAIKVQKLTKSIAHSSYFFRQPSGIYDAMNFGINRASGRYLLFLNAGDMLVSSTTIFDLLSKCNKFPDIDIFAHSVVYYTPQNFVYSVKDPSVQDKKYALFHHQGVLMRRGLLELLNGFNLKLRLAADGELLDRAIKLGKVKIDAQIIVAFDMTGTSSSRYWDLLKEIDSYRTPPSLREKLLLTFKNWLRSILVSSKLLPAFFRHSYLEHRELKVYKENPELRQGKFDLLD